MQKFNIVLTNGKCFVDPLASIKLDTALNVDCIMSKRKYTITPGQPKLVLGHARRPTDLKEGKPVFVEGIRVKEKDHSNSARALTSLYNMNDQGNTEFHL